MFQKGMKDYVNRNRPLISAKAQRRKGYTDGRAAEACDGARMDAILCVPASLRLLYSAIQTVRTSLPRMTLMQVHSWQAHRSSQWLSSVSKADTDGTSRDIGGEEAFVEMANILRFCLLPTASSGQHASARSAAPWEGDKIAITSKFPCCHDPICAIRGQSFFVLSGSENIPDQLYLFRPHFCYTCAIFHTSLGVGG